MVGAWIVSAQHYASLQIENDRLFDFLAHAVMNTGTTWILYIALEPYVRRFSPEHPDLVDARLRRADRRSARRPRRARSASPSASCIALFGISLLLVPALFGGRRDSRAPRNLQLLLGALDRLGVHPADDSEQPAERPVRRRGVRLRPRDLTGGLGRALLAAGLLTIFVLGESGGDSIGSSRWSSLPPSSSRWWRR